jgi:hypothetical protein
MSIHDWITILAASIVVIGWFVNSSLNRRHEIAKKRMEHRLDALQSFLPVFFSIKEERTDEPEFAARLAETRTKFQLYCHRNEIDSFESLITAIETRNHEAYEDALRDLPRLVREGIRSELGLRKYQYPKIQA